MLAPGGRCFITYFLLNDVSRDLIQQQRSDKAFIHQDEGYLTTNPADPKEAIAYAELEILQLYAQYHLDVAPPSIMGHGVAVQST